MLLENKVAVIYGAGGPIGGAVARAFAREGARVFLAGRTLAKLDTVANQCHPERSEGSGWMGREILRCAQDDRAEASTPAGVCAR